MEDDNVKQHAITFLPEKNRFQLQFGDPDKGVPFDVALLEFRDKPQGIWTLFHFEVPEEHRELGVEKKLVEACLREAKERGVKVKNTCGGSIKRCVHGARASTLFLLICCLFA